MDKPIYAKVIVAPLTKYPAEIQTESQVNLEWMLDDFKVFSEPYYRLQFLLAFKRKTFLKIDPLIDLVKFKLLLPSYSLHYLYAAFFKSLFSFDECARLWSDTIYKVPHKGKCTLDAVTPNKYYFSRAFGSLLHLYEPDDFYKNIRILMLQGIINTYQEHVLTLMGYGADTTAISYFVNSVSESEIPDHESISFIRAIAAKWKTKLLDFERQGRKKLVSSMEQFVQIHNMPGNENTLALEKEIYKEEFGSSFKWKTFFVEGGSPKISTKLFVKLFNNGYKIGGDIDKNYQAILNLPSRLLERVMLLFSEIKTENQFMIKNRQSDIFLHITELFKKEPKSGFSELDVQLMCGEFWAIVKFNFAKFGKAKDDYFEDILNKFFENALLRNMIEEYKNLFEKHIYSEEMITELAKKIEISKYNSLFRKNSEDLKVLHARQIRAVISVILEKLFFLKKVHVKDFLLNSLSHATQEQTQKAQGLLKNNEVIKEVISDANRDLEDITHKFKLNGFSPDHSFLERINENIKFSNNQWANCYFNYKHPNIPSILVERVYDEIKSMYTTSKDLVNVMVDKLSKEIDNIYKEQDMEFFTSCLYNSLSSEFFSDLERYKLNEMERLGVNPPPISNLLTTYEDILNEVIHKVYSEIMNQIATKDEIQGMLEIMEYTTVKDLTIQYSEQNTKQKVPIMQSIIEKFPFKKPAKPIFLNNDLQPGDEGDYYY